ncbi:autophagy-related protein 11-domain-containing protein [Lactarius psammicola]|nr:autophagy-related protein 11-domain-containing protein [Lactarius psammicola]
MVRICRAEDGEVFHTNAAIHDIEGSGSLEAFLRKEIGIEEDAALAYLSDGRKLGTDNVSDLAEVHDQTIFVFNKYYLDRDLDEVVKLLHMEPPLQPPIEESQFITPSPRLSELGAAFHRAAQTHMQSISRIVDSMRHQRSALRMASGVVDFRVLNVSDVVIDVRQRLDKRASLVAGVDTATELASRVRVHREFLSPAVQRAMDAGGPARTLSHYISGERIRRAVEECRDLRERLRHIEATVKQLVNGATDVRSLCTNVTPLDTAVALELSSQRLHGRIAEVTSTLEVPVVDVGPILQELRSLDVLVRDNLSSVVELKNAYTSQCLRTFRQIHTLSAGVVALPEEFTGLQASLDTKGTFSDIERLHNMVYAYGATMVEVVRRKEFSRVFHRVCQGFSEVMSNLSAAETKRRQAFRDEILGQLPFDLIGIDETLPSVEISASGGEDTNNHYTLEKHDISELLRVLEDSHRALNDNEAVPVRAQEVCMGLKRLVGKIDALESGFADQLQRSLFSSSKPAESGIPPKGASKEHAQNSKHSREKASGGALANEEELNAPEPEVVNLGEQRQAAVNDHERVEWLERELSLARAKLESETTARRTLEDRLSGLRSIFEKHKQRRGVLATGERQSRITEFFRQTGGSKARTGADKGEGAPSSAQASGDDRQPRSAVAGANGGQDQDALEHAELRAVMEAVERQLAETTTASGDGAWVEVGSRRADEDLQRVEREPQEASALRETDTAQSQQARRADSADQLIVQLMEVAATYRRTSSKALTLAQAAVTVPSTRNDSEVEEVEGPSERQTPPVDLDLSDPTGSTIRKWQKHCKGYRERSKAKISFRNFAEGDLALFLPTRNSTRPWAAFNVSFPHYFLQVTGRLAEQLKTREWIVARITSILERVAEPNDPESNPYGLGDGVKYYMVQVEDWNQPLKQRPSKKPSRPGAAPTAAVAAAAMVADAGDDAGVPEE